MGSLASNPSIRRLAISGANDVVSDLFDCALANVLLRTKGVLHFSELAGERDIRLADPHRAAGGTCGI